MTTFSAAAAVAPIVLWSDQAQGNIYLAQKNTFLDFYTDEKKAIKRSAAARSSSCGSDVRTTSGATSTSDRSSCPSVHSSDLQSPDTSPRATQKSPSSYNSNDNEMSVPAGYTMAPDGMSVPVGYMMVPMMMPTMTPYDEPAQEMHTPKVVMPPTNVERVPSKKQDLSKLNAEPVPLDQVTTLMVRGIPCSFSQDSLMKLFDDAGLKGKYDFLYLPRAGSNSSNLGYAFINFVDPSFAALCSWTFNGVPLHPARSAKICTISPGDIQGLANLRQHFRRTAVSRGSRGPVYLKVYTEEEENQLQC